MSDYLGLGTNFKALGTITYFNCICSENNGHVAFIGIVIHNHFVLLMSLFIDLTFRLPNREASSEQFSAVLPLQLQKDTVIEKK